VQNISRLDGDRRRGDINSDGIVVYRSEFKQRLPHFPESDDNDVIFAHGKPFHNRFASRG
jgi:hypothetical protein